MSTTLTPALIRITLRSKFADDTEYLQQEIASLVSSLLRSTKCAITIRSCRASSEDALVTMTLAIDFAKPESGSTQTLNKLSKKLAEEARRSQVADEIDVKVIRLPQTVDSIVSKSRPPSRRGSNRRESNSISPERSILKPSRSSSPIGSKTLGAPTVHFAPPTTLHISVERDKGRRKSKKLSSRKSSRNRSEVSNTDLMESLENLHPAQSSKHSRGKKRSEKKRDSSKRSPSLRIVRDQAMLGLVPSFEHGLATESKYSTKPAREKSDVEAWRERWRRTQAALKLQAIFRGKIVRKIVDVKNKRLRRFRILMLCAARAKILAWNVRRKIAATRRMQAIHRGNQVRNKVSEMLANRLRSALILVQRVWRKRRAAVKIQSRFRGWRDWIRLREIIAGEGTRQFVVRQNRDIVLKGLWGGGEMRVRFPVGTCCLVSISSGMWRLHKDGEARPVGELKLRGAGRVYSSSLSVISVLPPVASRSKIGPFSQEKFLSVECALSSGASDALTLGNRVFSVSTKAKKLVMSDASGVDRREYVLPSVHGYVRIFMEVLSKSVVRLSLQWAGTRWLVVRQRVTGWENPRNFKLSGGAKLSPACPVIPVEVVREQFPDGLKKSLPDVAMVRSEKADASRRNVAPRPEEEEVYTINSTESMSSRDNRRSKRSVILTRPSRLSEKTPARNSTPADAIISAAGVFRNSVEQIFGARQEIGDNTSYSSSSVSSITSLSNSVRGRRAAMRGVSSLISCRGNRTSLTAETDELTCNDPCGSTWAITTEPLQEQQGREIYMSFKISVRGAQTYPTDDGHHGMFGIGFTTNDEIDEIPKKKSVCLFGYNFSSPTAESRRKSLAGQSRIRYTTFYDGREWKKLEDSLLPKVNDEVELVIMGDRVCVLVNDWAVFISDELDPSLLRRMRTQRIYGIVDLCGGPVYDVACELNTEVEATVLRALKAKEPTRLLPMGAS